ncbi:50S ribosomal protein L32 [Myxococcota bacterium]|nr:50S ribosomal protein L32 [Myxococcota bacterium]
MIAPKRRTSRSRRDKRRSHDALKAPARSVCSNCGAPKAPHRAWRNCGWYGDRLVLESDAE